MPRIAVSGVDAAARQKFPREFSLLQQLGGTDVEAEVRAPCCDCKLDRLLDGWLTVHVLQALGKAAATYGDADKAKSLVGSGGRCACHCAVTASSFAAACGVDAVHCPTALLTTSLLLPSPLMLRRCRHF